MEKKENTSTSLSRRLEADVVKKATKRASRGQRRQLQRLHVHAHLLRPETSAFVRIQASGARHAESGYLTLP